MSFASFMALPIDRETDSFGQSGNDLRSDFFDDYLTFDSADLTSSSFSVQPGPPHLVKSGGDRGGADSAGTWSSVWGEDEALYTEAHHPSRGVPAEYQNAASPQRTTKGKPFLEDNLGRAAYSDFDLLSLESITLQSPQVNFSPPSSPQLQQSPVAETPRGRRRFIERISKTFRKGVDATSPKRLSPNRKATSPAKMMHAPQYGGDQNIHDWGRLALEASKFDFGFQNNAAPLSPPPSTRISDASDNGNGTMSATHHPQGVYWDQPQPQYPYRSQIDLNSPLTTPPADITTFQQANLHHAAQNNMIYASPQRNHASASWTQAPIAPDYTLDNSSAYLTEDESNPLWWGHATTVPLAQPSPSTQNFPRQPAHTTKSLAMQLQAELAYNANELALSPSGLMISMPHSPGHGPPQHQQQSFVVDSASQGYFAPVPQPQPQAQPQPYLDHPHQPHHRYTSQSQPPPLPRTYISPPKVRRDKSHSREHSSSSPSPKSRSTSMHVTKKRSSSRARGNSEHRSLSAKSSRTALGDGRGGGLADFVNFTPHDSMKILTGVAPSGSSKTKARREKEAMEKTRRLSQAAVRAVQAAGGSIESLVEEGLFVPPGE
jgi:hypothetical protein